LRLSMLDHVSITVSDIAAADRVGLHTQAAG
jgi:hypothetical protein